MSDELREMSDETLLCDLQTEFLNTTRAQTNAGRLVIQRRCAAIEAELLARLKRGRKAEEELAEGRRLWAEFDGRCDEGHGPHDTCPLVMAEIALDEWLDRILGGEKKEGE